MLLNTLQCIGQCPQQRMTQPQTSVMAGLEKPLCICICIWRGQEDSVTTYLVKSLGTKIGNQGYSASGKKHLVAERSLRNGGPQSAEPKDERRTVCRGEPSSTWMTCYREVSVANMKQFFLRLELPSWGADHWRGVDSPLWMWDLN